MQLGLIGLGRMGGGIGARIRAAGHEVVGYARSPSDRDVASLEELVAALQAPRVVWVMVPPGAAQGAHITALGDLLSEGDLVVDGGNTKFTDDVVHAQQLSAKGIAFVDCGVSGGIWGKKHRHGLMCVGDADHVERVMPIFDALRPEGPRDEGFVHAGDVGAGHYAKMVHNGIEAPLMQAWTESYELLSKREDIIKDVTGTFKAWQRGTVVRSWLLELLVKALEEDPEFVDIEGYVEDSGEGRWTVEEALNNAVPVPTISASIFARFVS